MRKFLQVSFDLDGVLADFTTSVITAANELRPGWMPPDYKQRDWNYLDVFGSIPVWTGVFEHMLKTPNLWLKSPAFEETVDVLRQYQQRVDNVLFYFTTARQASVGLPVDEQTRMWLQMQGLIWEDVIVVPSGSKKAGVYDQMGIDLSIDDLSETVRMCNLLPRHKAYLLDWAYNRKDYTLPRVRSVAGFLEKVERRRVKL